MIQSFRRARGRFNISFGMEINSTFFRIVTILRWLSYFNCFGARIFIFHGVSQCPDGEKNPAHFNGIVTNVSDNVYGVAGDVVINDFMDGPIEVFRYIRSKYNDSRLFISTHSYSILDASRWQKM